MVAPPSASDEPSELLRAAAERIQRGRIPVQQAVKRLLQAIKPENNERADRERTYASASNTTNE